MFAQWLNIRLLHLLPVFITIRRNRCPLVISAAPSASRPQAANLLSCCCQGYVSCSTVQPLFCGPYNAKKKSQHEKRLQERRVNPSIEQDNCPKHALPICQQMCPASTRATAACFRPARGGPLQAPPMGGDRPVDASANPPPLFLPPALPPAFALSSRHGHRVLLSTRSTLVRSMSW